MSTKRPVAWGDILLANGLGSLALGLAGFALARLYLEDVRRWVIENPPEQVRHAADLLLCGYVLYALVMTLLGLIGGGVAAYWKGSPPAPAPDDRKAAESPPTSGAAESRPPPC